MNLRQYRRSEVVQGGKVIGVDPVLDAVTIADADGQPLTIVSPGLCQDGGPPALGDQLLLYSDGNVWGWIPAAVFDAKWEPVKGAILS